MIVRPATKEDIAQFAKFSFNPTIKAWVGEIDGKLVVMAGIAFVQGRWFGFCDIIDERAKQYKITFGRAAVRAMREFRKQGVKYIYADRDVNEQTSGRWLESLGFHVDPRTLVYYRWKANG